MSVQWSAWGVTNRGRAIFWASRYARDPSQSGDSAYSFQNDRRRYRSMEAAQRRADELNQSRQP